MLCLFLFQAGSYAQYDQNYENDIFPPPQFWQAPQNCSRQSAAFANTYGKLATYIPTASTPVKTIKVNFNIFQDGSGGGNFMTPAQDLGTDVARLNQIFDWMKAFYTSNSTPSDGTVLPPVTPLAHEYITFELGGIYFYNVASVYYTTSKDLLIDQIELVDPSRLNSLNICFNGACYLAKVSSVAMGNNGSGYLSTPNVVFNPAGATGTAIMSGGTVTGVTMTNMCTQCYSGAPPTVTFVGGSPTVAATGTAVMSGASAATNFPDYNLTTDLGIIEFNRRGDPSHNTGGDFAMATTLAHELGHSLDLRHTYGNGAPGSAICGSDPEYLTDIFGAYPPGTNCPHLTPAAWSCGSLTNTPPKQTNNMMGGNQCSGYFSPMQTGQMHRALSLKTIRRYVKDSPFDPTPWNITANETWDFDIRWYSDIVVKSGAMLTIQCNLFMADQAKIVVERGGKLIVDGGTISSVNKMWQGIYVWGDKTKSQNTLAGGYNHTDQGYLEVKNSGVIENMIKGIRTVKVNTNGTLDDNYTGGIIISTTGNFKNNQRAVEFRSYRNFNPSTLVTTNNVSSFTNSTFITNAQLKDNTLTPLDFIRMWDVRGVTIKDNKFKCTHPGYTDTQRGKGITSLDAIYDVTKLTGGVGNGFENLNIAIEITNSASAPVATNYISYNYFTNNRHGVYSSGFGIGPNVTYNNFSKSTPAVFSPSSFGFYSTGTKPVFLACNDFTNLTYGNLLLNSGTTGGAVCWIAENDFVTNFRGIQTENSNQTLQVRYNMFTADATTQGHWYNTGTGTLPQQGFCAGATTPAGNKFLGAAPTTLKDIRNDNVAFAYYHHNSPLADVVPVLFGGAGVTLTQCPVAWTATNYCNAGMMMAGGGSGGGNSSEEFSLAESFEAIADQQQIYGDEIQVAEITNYIYDNGIQNDPAASIEYLEGLKTEVSNWMLAPLYIYEENFDAAEAVIKTLEAENVNEATKLNYFNLLLSVGNQGRNLSELDSSEVAALDIIAAGTSEVRDNARSILSFFYGRQYSIEEVYAPEVPFAFSEPLADALTIPNVITPNGDGRNDVFSIEGLPERSSITIYNSGGTQLYHSANYENNWPPSDIPAGRYYYTIVLPDGSNESSSFDVVY